MKLIRLATAVATLVASSAVLAGSLTGSSNVTFLALDGQKVKKGVALQVSDSNTHQVVVEVASIIDSGSDGSYFESDPIVVSFKGSSENIQVIAPNLRNSADVNRFKQSPSLKLQTASGKVLDHKLDYLKGEGFLPNVNVEANLAQYNAGSGVAAVAGFSQQAMPAAMPMASAGKAAKGKVMVQGENIAEQQLQYWFQQADKATQKRFLDWAKKQ
ncbi:hypothetical protein A4G20_10480 [Pasteurellaceae bacterium RH1A]|nr:hypothetical protein A4G20_10480 [Pasteurellaceae bacterium RH1A]